MSKLYIVLILILIGLSGGLLLLPEIQRSDDLDPESLFKAVNNRARYLSVDHVAERLINEDPSIMLIDVRSIDQSMAFALPSSMSIPLDEILLPEWEDYLEQEGMDIVLYSNGDVIADQAWMICTRKGYKNLYVMAGGLNKWFSDIMQPVAPDETAPSEEFDLYLFRKAARLHFGGGTLEIETTPSADRQAVKLVKREKKTVTEGGC